MPYADIVSTTTHKTLRGPRGGMLLCKAEHADKVDKAVFPGLQGGPHMHTLTAIAVALAEADTPEFVAYAKQIVANAKALAEKLLEYGFNLVSGGTDNHLMLIDLRNKGIPGKKLAKALDRARIVTNYNTVPGDPAPPFNPSGLRLGTPAITTRGIKEAEARQIADVHPPRRREHRQGIRDRRGRQGSAAAVFAVPGARALHHPEQERQPAVSERAKLMTSRDRSPALNRCHSDRVGSGDVERRYGVRESNHSHSRSERHRPTHAQSGGLDRSVFRSRPWRTRISRRPRKPPPSTGARPIATTASWSCRTSSIACSWRPRPTPATSRSEDRHQEEVQRPQGRAARQNLCRRRCEYVQLAQSEKVQFAVANPARFQPATSWPCAI